MRWIDYEDAIRCRKMSEQVTGALIIGVAIVIATVLWICFDRRTCSVLSQVRMENVTMNVVERLARSEMSTPLVRRFCNGMSYGACV